MADDISVFVSADMSELECEREVAENAIKELCLKPWRFERTPASSRSPQDAYLDQVRRCQIFTLILWRSFREAVQKEYEEAVKHTKPILVFVKSLTEREHREPRLTKFIDGLEGSGKGRGRTVFKRFRGLSDLACALKEALANEVARSYVAPLVTKSREQLYDLGSEVATGAQTRLYVVQRTPSLFLGSREYSASDVRKIDHEQTFLKGIEDWIEAATTNRSRKFRYFFDLASTRTEVQRVREKEPAFAAYVEERIRKYKEIENLSGSRLRFIPITSPFFVPMIVGDNRWAIWILGADHTAVSISQENERLAVALVDLLEGSIEREIPVESILRELSLPGAL